MTAIPGEGDYTMPRQHSDIPISARPALLVSLLLAIILPASLLVCTYATADNAATEYSVADAVTPTTHANSGEEVGREAEQQSSNASDITTEPTETATTPISPISPSPLATSSPTNPTHPTPSISPTPDKTSTLDEEDGAGLEARASSPAPSSSSRVLVLSGVGEMDGVGCVGFVGEDVARGEGEIGEIGVVAVSVGSVVMSEALLDCCSASRPTSSPLFACVVGVTASATLYSVAALSAVA